MSRQIKIKTVLHTGFTGIPAQRTNEYEEAQHRPDKKAAFTYRAALREDLAA
jgi:hypothetical protein